MHGEVVLLRDDLAGRDGEHQIVVEQRIERVDIVSQHRGSKGGFAGFDDRTECIHFSASHRL